MKAQILSGLLLRLAVTTSMAYTASDTNFALVSTISGRTYQNCRILKTDPDGVILAHHLGLAKILYSDLPDSMRVRLGYDATACNSYNRDLTEQRQKDREWKQELQREFIKALKVSAASGDTQPGESPVSGDAYTGAPLNYGWPGLDFGYGNGDEYSHGRGPWDRRILANRFHCNSIANPGRPDGLRFNFGSNSCFPRFQFRSPQRLNGVVGNLRGTNGRCANQNTFFAVPPVRVATPPLAAGLRGGVHAPHAVPAVHAVPAGHAAPGGHR